jgi:hypothetical protein
MFMQEYITLASFFIAILDCGVENNRGHKQGT